MASSKCATCNKPSLSLKPHKKCVGCKSSSYCSKECQREDWPTHKLICAAFKPFTNANPRPSPEHKLALLLPVDNDQPKFVWMHSPPSEEHFFESPQVEEFIGENTFKRWVYVSSDLASSNPGVLYNDLHFTIPF